MQYMIDTNTFVYLCRNELDEIDAEILKNVFRYEHSFILSSESIIEIANLLAVGRLNMSKWKTFDDVQKSADEFGFSIRYVSEAHLKTLFKLRRAPGHNDPGDLVIIAQAITEKLPIISSDTDFPFYTAQGLDLIFNTRRKKRR